MIQGLDFIVVVARVGRIEWYPLRFFAWGFDVIGPCGLGVAQLDWLSWVGRIKWIDGLGLAGLLCAVAWIGLTGLSPPGSCTCLFYLY